MSVAGAAAGSPSLLSSLRRRRERGGAPDPLVRCVDSVRIGLSCDDGRSVPPSPPRIKLSGPPSRRRRLMLSRGHGSVSPPFVRAGGARFAWRGLQDGGGGRVKGFCSPVLSASRRRLLQRRRGAGRRCIGVGRRYGTGSVRETALLQFGWWKEVVGAGVRRRLCCSGTSCSRSKKCGEVPRPTIHSGKCAVVYGGACSLARNAVRLPWLSLLWHSLGSRVSRCSPSSPQADAPASAMVGLAECGSGGCRDPEGLVCDFLFAGVFSVSFCGVLSLWTVPERSYVCCTWPLL